MPDNNNNKAKTSYRTKAKARAESNENIANANIYALAIPTFHDYEYAVSLHQEGKAYLYPIMTTSELKFEDGEIYFEGALEPISAAELKNIHTQKGIESIDIPLLTAYYSIILQEFYSTLKNGDELKPIITMHIPELMRCMGLLKHGGGLNKNEVDNMIISYGKH